MLALEALVWLIAAWLIVRLVPFRRWRGLLGPVLATPQPDQPADDLSPELSAQAKGVGWGIEAVSRDLPWKATCLMRALAGRQMLRRRGLQSMVALGARSSNAENLEAHAWLITQGQVLLGASEAVGYKPLVHFGEACPVESGHAASSG